MSSLHNHPNTIKTLYLVKRGGHEVQYMVSGKRGDVDLTKCDLLAKSKKEVDHLDDYESHYFEHIDNGGWQTFRGCMIIIPDECIADCHNYGRFKIDFGPHQKAYVYPVTKEPYGKYLSLENAAKRIINAYIADGNKAYY